MAAIDLMGQRVGEDKVQVQEIIEPSVSGAGEPVVAATSSRLPTPPLSRSVATVAAARS